MHAVSENENEIDAPSRRLGSMKKLILFNNIRMRILEHLRFLDIKTDSHSYLVNELSDFFRHRGQLELERSRNLDKILHCFQLSHNELMSKSNKQSSYECWHHLIGETQSLSYDYATLSEMYNVNVLFQLQKVLRIYKKYQELVFETHEELLRILRNFFTTIRTYNIYQNEYKVSEAKSSDAESKRMQHDSRRKDSGKLLGVTKYGLTEKQTERDKLETLKARNIYKHYTETSNANIHKCMLRDLSDIIYGMDTGFCLMVSRAMLAHVTTDQKQYYSKLHCFDDPSTASRTMDISKAPNQLCEDKNETNVQNNVDFEFELQLQLLKLKEDNLRKNLEKIYRILDMVELSSTGGGDTVTPIEEKPRTLPAKLTPIKHKEGGRLYILANISPIAKQISFRHNSAQKAKLEPKSKLSSALEAVHMPHHLHRTSCAHKSTGRPKLFGGSLEEYLRITNESIPLIMRSCIRVIKLYGLHSQGIFRVSGSQVEILNFRDSFERGEDPLAGATDASDMNSVAGVLKLYLRELKEPLFPIKYFDIFKSLIQLDSKYEVVAGMRNFFKNISKSVVIVIRFLFSFLNHLSEHANENMMDAFNLAVSFGPTLMPVPEDKKQLQYQTQLNELIKVLIVYHQEVFPKDLGGPQYDKFSGDDMHESNTINHTAEQLNDKPHHHESQTTDME